MKKLVLLDADVIIDLHTLDLFTKICSAYTVYVTRTVFNEAKYYRQGGRVYPVDIADKVTIIDEVSLESLETVQNEARQAFLGIDPGEKECIACLHESEEDFIFCTCDQAAIKLISYMELENKAMSIEKALRDIGHRKKNLYPRHFDKTFESCIQEGKALRVLYKKFS